jgi:cell filamentation protein
MTDDPYVYPGTSVLRNLLDLRHQADLDAAERQLTRLRAAEGIPTGDFDLTHLRSLHRHLFQDIYAWAGEVRTVEIAKGGHQFMFRQFIGSGMADVHRRIAAGGYFVGLSLEAFAAAVGTILGDVNYIHPFREGNGRTQLQYLKQLCERAGHRLDLRCIDGEAWHAASRSAHMADYQPMGEAIRAALDRTQHLFMGRGGGNT